MSSALSTLNTTTEVRPLSKAPNPQLLPGLCSIGVFMVCVCVCVCVCTWIGEMQSTNSEYGSPYLAKSPFIVALYNWFRNLYLESGV